MNCRKLNEVCTNCNEFGSTCAHMKGIENNEIKRLKKKLEDAVRMLLEEEEDGCPRITQSRGAEILGLTAMEMREKRREWVEGGTGGKS